MRILEELGAFVGLAQGMEEGRADDPALQRRGKRGGAYPTGQVKRLGDALDCPKRRSTGISSAVLLTCQVKSREQKFRRCKALKTMSLQSEYDIWHQRNHDADPGHDDGSSPWYRLVREYLGSVA